jgi:glycosyltransferase involved in cell wall biosynthesis
MPRVSVVVPCFNRTDLLARTLSSIENQTFQDFDVVLVNDGGQWKDDLDLSFMTRRTKVLHRENGGPGAARNTGINSTDSEFIAYLDDDDQWHPNHLETLLKCSFDYSAGMVFGVADVRDQGRRIRLWGECEFDKFILDSFHTIFPLSACMHRREPILSAGCFDESPLLVGPEDCEFVIRYSDVCLPVPSWKCTVTMHRERSMTREPRDKWVDTLAYVINKLSYREHRRNWLMLYRAVAAAAHEGRDYEYQDWSVLLDEQLPHGVRRSGIKLYGSIELSPVKIKAYCRAALKEQ